MNVNAKILNKILANWIQVYIKYKDTYKNMKYTYMYNIKNNASWTSGVYWKNIRLFKPWKINVVNHINRLKGKKSYDSPDEFRKWFDKIQHYFT